MFAWANLIPAGILAGICAWTDIKSRHIYNKHTLPALAAGVIYAVLTGQCVHLYGSLAVFAVYFLLFVAGKGKIGGGDVKLAVPLSLFLGYEAVILGSLLAGLVLMAWGFAFTWYRTGNIRAGALVALGRLPGGEVPYGAVLGPASLLAAALQLL